MERSITFLVGNLIPSLYGKWSTQSLVPSRVNFSIVSLYECVANSSTRWWTLAVNLNCASAQKEAVEKGRREDCGEGVYRATRNYIDCDNFGYTSINRIVGYGKES